ncbi:CBS domain-containing protein [Magnetovibrio sp. PR-2]|uniref:CBS domain-containing protein n=1 Tax=Magnetovibrio sp. PR-2 TaxID=3120356 RepID=UPI002FCDEADD
MHRRIIPDVVVQQDIIALNQTKSVHDAVQLMSSHKIAAIAVTDGADDRLVGILSERDITHRVLACGLNPQATLLSDVMTDNPECVRPGDACLDAIELMLSRNIRHLPVVTEEHKVVAMISMRDLLEASLKELGIQIDEKRDAAFSPE